MFSLIKNIYWHIGVLLVISGCGVSNYNYMEEGVFKKRNISHKYFDVSEFTIPADSHVSILPRDHLPTCLKLRKRDKRWLCTKKIAYKSLERELLFPEDLIDLILEFVTEIHWSERVIVVTTSANMSMIDNCIDTSHRNVRSLYFDDTGHILFVPTDIAIEITSRDSTNYSKKINEVMMNTHNLNKDKPGFEIKMLLRNMKGFNIEYFSLFKELLKGTKENVEDFMVEFEELKQTSRPILELCLKEDGGMFFLKAYKGHLEGIGDILFGVIINSEGIKLYPFTICNQHFHDKLHSEEFTLDRLYYQDKVRQCKSLKEALLNSKIFLNLDNFIEKKEFNEYHSKNQELDYMSFIANTLTFKHPVWLCLDPKNIKICKKVAKDRFLILHNFKPLEIRSTEEVENNKSVQTEEDILLSWCLSDRVPCTNDIENRPIHTNLPIPTSCYNRYDDDGDEDKEYDYDDKIYENRFNIDKKKEDNPFECDFPSYQANVTNNEISNNFISATEHRDDELCRDNNPRDHFVTFLMLILGFQSGFILGALYFGNFK